MRPMSMLGVSKTRQETNPPARADELADMVFPDHDGRDVRLGDLWKDRPAVLVWLRHYG
jgi:prostamide/prostaglandin F2alpha synthase